MTYPRQKTILFCPLDWGLGHIARDLPLIREFQKNGHRVIVAASPGLAAWLKTEAPQIETTLFDGPEIRYSKGKFLILKLFTYLPELFRWLKKERERVSELVMEYQPHLIVSDNRYGARHPKVYSVIITHQLMLKMPRLLKWLEYPLHRFVKSLVERFDECWVPDFSKKYSLAGDLVHKFTLPANAKMIGPLSRFDNNFPEESTNFYHPTDKSILAIISGPEPQRTIFEKRVTKLLKTSERPATIITGTLNDGKKKVHGNNKLKIFAHLPSAELLKTIKTHHTIITRAGYSTIMDMYFLKRNIWLVPTPGQTEQLYLARYHRNKTHSVAKQHQLEKILTEEVNARGKACLAPGSEHFRKVLRAYFNQ